MLCSLRNHVLLCSTLLYYMQLYAAICNYMYYATMFSTSMQLMPRTTMLCSTLCPTSLLFSTLQFSLLLYSSISYFSISMQLMPCIPCAAPLSAQPCASLLFFTFCSSPLLYFIICPFSLQWSTLLCTILLSLPNSIPIYLLCKVIVQIVHCIVYSEEQPASMQKMAKLPTYGSPMQIMSQYNRCWCSYAISLL